ncbi:hypothetical protein VEE28_12890 [Escherichia coli]|nr:hypothetical protein VEE28_12890 [Escherichia coli]
MKRSIIAAAVFSSFFMSAGVFAADVDTGTLTIKGNIAESPGNDSNLLIVFYVQIMPDDFVMQLHRF